MEKSIKEVKDYSNLIYDSLFLLGFVFLIAAYLTKNIDVFIIGLIFLVLSLFTFELWHKQQDKKPYVYLFYIVMGILTGFLVYLSKDYVIKIMRSPFASTLLYILYSLVIVVLIAFIIEHLKKSKGKQSEKQRPMVKRTSVKSNAEKEQKISKMPFKFPKKVLPALAIIALIIALYSIRSIILKLHWLISVFLGFILITFLLLLIYFLVHKGSSGIEKKKIQKEIQEDDSGIRIKREGFETEFDMLYNMVQKKGRIKISAVARIFGIDRKMAEEWASILEGHNLVKINYPLIGEAELVKIQEKNE